MNEFWIKNKWTLMSTLVYLFITLLFGEITRYSLFIFLSSIFIIPFLQNFKIESDSFFWNIISGLIFGFLVTPFTFSTFPKEINSLLSFPYHNQILYFVLILFLNFCYVTHRNGYKVRKKSEGLLESRDEKIFKILNPVKRRFFQ